MSWYTIIYYLKTGVCETEICKVGLFTEKINSNN